MNKGVLGNTDDLRTKRFYHGTRAELRPGDLIEPSNSQEVREGDRMTTHVYLTPNLDEAIWEAELAVGEGPGRVYLVEPIGQVADASELTGRKSPGYPSMSCCSRDPLRVTGEVTEWSLYHGTRADLKPGDLIEPGYNSNYGKRTKASYVYLTRTLDAATWGAELAAGAGLGRIYVVKHERQRRWISALANIDIDEIDSDRLDFDQCFICLWRRCRQICECEHFRPTRLRNLDGFHNCKS